MKLRLFAWAIVVLTSLSDSFAVEVRDQHWPWNSDGVWQFSSEKVGTIFDIGVDGLLSRIDVYIDPAPGLEWEIHPVENGLPKLFNAPPLASGTFVVADPRPDLAVSLDVSGSNLMVRSGQQFALCIIGNVRLGGSSWMSYRGSDAPDSREFRYSTLSQYVWLNGPSNYDPPYASGYSTYIDVVPEPGSCLMLCANMLATLFLPRRR